MIIYKYEVPYKPSLTIGMPHSFQFLSLQVQDSIPCMWVSFIHKSHANPGNCKPIEFRWVRTGVYLDFSSLHIEGSEGAIYRGTIQPSGGCVMHLFQVQ